MSGAAETIVVDNGSEFTSRALAAWAYSRGGQVDFIHGEKPVENAFITVQRPLA
jgi:hypothetical protein